MPSPLRISTWTVRARGNPFIALAFYTPVYVDDGRRRERALTTLHCRSHPDTGLADLDGVGLLAAAGDERTARVGGC